MTSTLFKNIPFALPFAFCRTNKVECNIKFTESCKYDFKDSDQLDWNKLIGLKVKYFKTHECTCMIGHRYAPKTGKHELNIYLHDEELYLNTPLNRKMNPAVKSISTNQKVFISIETRKKEWVIKIDNEEFRFPKSSNKTKAWLIRDWFGGNRKPPHKMKKVFEFIN